MTQRSQAEYRTAGSLALKPAPQPAPSYPQERYERRRPAEERTRPAPAPRKAAKSRIRPKKVLLVMAIFGVIFGLLYRQISIEQSMVELHKMRTTLATEQKRGEDLRLELSLQHDIARVQAVAREEMNMDYPNVDQTHVVVLPPVKTPSTAEQVVTNVTDNQPEGLAAWIEEIREKLDL